MALLYPPQIEGTIPAFYGNTFKIPFQHNPTVAKSDYIGFVVKFKEVNTNTELFVTNTATEDIINKNVIFNIPDYQITKLRKNDFYKIQLAYLDQNNNAGYFSTIGVVKYTSTPSLILIKGDKTAFDFHNINILTQEVIGEYSNSDSYEKLYSTQLTIYDENKNIFYQSKEIIHNNFNDDNNIVTLEENDSSIVQYEHYNLYKELADGKTYSVQLTATTINGLECISPLYFVRNGYTFEDNFKEYFLEANNNFEESCISVSLRRNFLSVNQDTLTGLFIISRRSLLKDENTWYPIKNISLNNAENIIKLFDDFIVEQGGVYQYAIQQYNGSLTSNKMFSNEITADFEDIFLFDGKKQLKLRFNPKISSFKTTKLENKIDTVGGIYPVFFRNAYTNYKEFPINALLSYLSDNDQHFASNEELGLVTNDAVRTATNAEYNPPYSKNRKDVANVYYDTNFIVEAGNSNWSADTEFIISGETDNENILNGNGEIDITTNEGKFDVEGTPWEAERTTNLTANNYAAERAFKLKVLDWLNDGNPKLFKSAAEGTYIVRLMNISLAPTDQLGRMLHSVSGTAYEVAEINFENLKNYNFIDLSIPSLKNMLAPYSIDLTDNDAFVGSNENYHTLYLPSKPVYKPQFTNIPQGTKIRFTDNFGVQSIIEIFMRDSYLVEEDIPFTNIEISFPEINNETVQQGLFNVFYSKPVKSYIDYIKNISFTTVPLQSFSSDEMEIDIIAKIKSLKNFKYNYVNKTIAYDLEDITSIKYLKFEKKDFNLPAKPEEKENYKIKIKNSVTAQEQEIDLSDLDSYVFPLTHGLFNSIKIGKNIIAYIAYDKSTWHIELDINELNKQKITVSNFTTIPYYNKFLFLDEKPLPKIGFYLMEKPQNITSVKMIQSTNLSPIDGKGNVTQYNSIGYSINDIHSIYGYKIGPLPAGRYYVLAKLLEDPKEVIYCKVNNPHGTFLNMSGTNSDPKEGIVERETSRKIVFKEGHVPISSQKYLVCSKTYPDESTGTQYSNPTPFIIDTQDGDIIYFHGGGQEIAGKLNKQQEIFKKIQVLIIPVNSDDNSYLINPPTFPSSFNTKEEYTINVSNPGIYVLQSGESFIGDNYFYIYPQSGLTVSAPEWWGGYKYKYNLGKDFIYRDELVRDESCVIAFGNHANSNQIAWYTEDEGVQVNDN